MTLTAGKGHSKNVRIFC